MKPKHRALRTKHEDDTRTILIIGLVVLFLQIAFNLTVGAQQNSSLPNKPADSLTTELNSQLHQAGTTSKFNFPKTVERFYQQNQYSTNWLRGEENVGPTVIAMLLLDCVKQYGLQPQNFHPGILTYEHMQAVLNARQQVSASKKIEFELALTDAMLTVINHLHYGALNPKLSSLIIDDGVQAGLQAEMLLAKATKSSDLMQVILSVQPKIEQYKQLQGYLKLMTGQYTCDSYETSDEQIKKIAINMERLRWNSVDSDNYIFVNIPAFKLNYVTPQLTTEYKIVVGKFTTPTPMLSSTVGYLETAPDWRIPNSIFIKEMLPKAKKDFSYFQSNHMAVYDQFEKLIPLNAQTIAQIMQNPSKYHARQTAGCDNALGKVVFRFSNSESIYLHDTPEQQYFNKSKRALSHGCIRVANAEQLAKSLLKNDGQELKVAAFEKAISAYSNQQFALHIPVPIVITYLTIAVENGLLVSYDDVYKKDEALKIQMFGSGTVKHQLNK